MVRMDKQHSIKYVWMKIDSSEFNELCDVFMWFSIGRIALKCLDYQDKTLLTNSVSGSVALQLKLLNLLGYKCIPVSLSTLHRAKFSICFFLF